MSLEITVAISNKFGKNPEYVLAGGGNTSFKDKDFLYIKGSGTTLATINADGFVKMCRRGLSEIWVTDYPADTKAREAAVLRDMMKARCEGEENKRPSVETLLHDLLPYKYVVHLHPALVNGLTCSKGGEKKAIEVLGGNIVWIEETEPGYILAKKVFDKLECFKAKKGYDSKIIVLQNHGIFVAADIPDEIESTYDEIIKKLSVCLLEEPDFSPVQTDRERAASIVPAIRMLLLEDGKSVVTYSATASVMKLSESREKFEAISSAYTPDHIVYCKPYPIYVEYRDDIEAQYSLIEKGIEDYKQKYGYKPRIVVVQKIGVFAWGSSKKNADTAMSLFYDSVKIAVYTKSFGGRRFLSDKLIDFIVNWEAESYRANTFGGGKGKRIEEKIAVVTGSAQGFGQGIAEEMIKEGTNMVIADLNFRLAKKNANEMCALYGEGKAISVEVDVTKEDSVKNLFTETCLTFGGIDVFVSNAGVVKAGTLEEMTLEALDFVTKVNYNAYFLCSKYAAAIMKIQHRFAPSYMMDIVQVNSKSGLTGSNKNFAYAGSKFGGIGLTQSFALELAEFNIKVNATCPGNFLDGPLWTDPEKGLFIQYLKAGKVPGAKTVEDIKRAYEAKVPMNRGCLPIDVTRAIFYCMEQEYETGQAIPVTGGQNMLK